jgi:DNA gyrase subunit A
VLPGPDFPGGGIIVDDGSLRAAYETGRGTIRVRARASIEPVTAKRAAIVVTELPYMVGPERVVAKITELMRQGRLDGAADVKNLTDRNNALRVVVECRADADPQRVLTHLFRLTPLEETFGINNVALVDGVPTTLGLYDLCRHYVEHRLEVVVRRTRFRLDKARAREHIVAGLLVALDAIDRVIAIIRGSADVGQARDRLMSELELSEIQATHILDMQLRRLTALEIDRLRDELEELRARIAEYEGILRSERRQRRIVLDELRAVAAEFGGPRRSEIRAVEELPSEVPATTGPARDELDLVDAGCRITLSTSGLLGRDDPDEPFTAKAGRHDVLAAAVDTITRSTVHVITDRARLLSVPAGRIPEVAGRSRGVAATEMFALARGERIVGLLAEPTSPVLLVTREGVAKRIAPEVVRSTRNGNPVLNLKNSDRVVAAFTTSEGSEVAMVASDGQALRTLAANVPVQGVGAAGVAGMKLQRGASVVAAGPVEFGTTVVMVTDEGQLKVTDVAEIPSKGRATGGVRIVRLSGFETAVVAAWLVRGTTAATLVSDGDPRQPDPTPETLDLQPTRRDGVAHATPRRIVALGRPRWQ